MHDAFAGDDPLVRKSEEEARMRILTHAEERALLAACGAREVAYKWRRGDEVKQVTAHDDGAKRAHLAPATRWRSKPRCARASNSGCAVRT